MEQAIGVDHVCSLRAGGTGGRTFTRVLVKPACLLSELRASPRLPGILIMDN